MNASTISVGLPDHDVAGEDISHEALQIASDEALEIAACTAKDGAANMTVAFCSGLDECPHRLPLLGARRSI